MTAKLVLPILAAALAAATPTPGWTQGVSQPTPGAEAIADADAAAIAAALLPKDIMIGLSVEWARRAVLMLPEQDPDSKALEAEYPGIHKAMWAAGELEMRRYSEEQLPVLRARVAQVISARFTAVEREAVRRFYDSPTGRKLIRSMYAGVDLAPALSAAIKADDYKLSESSIRTAEEKATQQAVQSLTKEDEPVLTALALTIPLAKLKSMGDEVRAVTMAWANAEDPQFDARLGKLMEEAVARFIEEHEAKR